MMNLELHALSIHHVVVDVFSIIGYDGAGKASG